MRPVMTFCLAAILLALFDSGPIQAAPGKTIYTMNTQTEHMARDSVLVAAEAQAQCAGFLCFYCAPREAVIVVNSTPPPPLFAPIVYVHAESSCGFHATNSYMIKERPYLAPIVYRSYPSTNCYRQRFTLSYR